jgi:hypothetical protein
LGFQKWMLILNYWVLICFAPHFVKKPPPTEHE